MIKEFVYSEKQRKVLVLKQTQTSIEGIDLNLLPDNVGNEIVKVVGDYTPSNETPKFDGWDKSWNCVWRKFLVHKIIEYNKDT